MKPIKNFEPLAKWILRFSLFAYVLCLYVDKVKTFNFKSVDYVINLLFMLFALFLLLGGLAKNATLTIISGFVIAIIAAYKAYLPFSESFTHPAGFLYLIIAGIALFFVSKGNS